MRRFLISLVCGILASCTDSSLDGAQLKGIPLDGLTVSVHEKGGEEQTAELHLNDQEKARLMAWLNSFAGSRMDLNTYAPVFTLEGQRLRINFAENRTVISYRETADPGETWKQYSRPATADDQHIRERILTHEQRKAFDR